MNFEWTQEERATAQAVGAAIAGLGAAALEDLETASVEGKAETLRRFLAAVAPCGYLGLAQDEAGRADVLRLMAGQLEVARASGSLYLAAESSARLFGSLAASIEDAAARDALLEPVRTGTAIAAVALSEPSEPESAPGTATARRDGGSWVLDGRKGLVTNGPFADRFAVSAGTAEGGLVVAFVEAGAEGLTVGAPVRTVGYDGLAIAPLALSGVRVQAERVLGPVPADALLRGYRQIEGLVLTMASVGLMGRAFEAAKSHARGHRRGGRHIYKWQEVSFKLAEMLTLLQTAELLAYRTGWLYGTADPEAETVIHCAKVFTSENAEVLASSAMQVLAGQGFLFGNVVERSYREAKYAQVAGTTSELGRMAVADAILDRYR